MRIFHDEFTSAVREAALELTKEGSTTSTRVIELAQVPPTARPYVTTVLHDLGFKFTHGKKGGWTRPNDTKPEAAEPRKLEGIVGAVRPSKGEFTVTELPRDPDAALAKMRELRAEHSSSAPPTEKQQSLFQENT